MKLSVVVPYRNRQEHLKIFLENIIPYLKNENIEFHIFVIHQEDELPFNRAKLLNIGFIESSNLDYFVFHDVDMVPIEKKVDYGYVNIPTHLASCVEQFGWRLPYEGYFGGVTLFDKASFVKINGYSNNYWGWGAEDDDVLLRCAFKELQVLRKMCFFRSLSHEREIEPKQYNKNLEMLKKFNEKRDFSDGITSTEYTIISRNDLNDHTTMINVKI